MPLSQLQQATRPPAADLRTLALLPSDRAQLHQRIEQRLDAMLAGGFLDEVRALRARGDLHPDLPALRSVGYRQAWQHLDGAPLFAVPRGDDRRHAQLAKRQIDLGCGR